MSSAATKAGTCRTYKNWPAAGVLVAALLVSVPTPTSAMPEHAVVLEIDGVIGPATTDYVTRKFGAMKPADIGLIILRVNTPGGLESSMREIIRVVLSSPIPVAAYVAPNGARAASAGTYITYASAIAAMAPGTNLGAATPIQLGRVPQLPGLKPEQPPSPPEWDLVRSRWGKAVAL